MRQDIPAWAKYKVSPEDPDFFEIRRAHRQGRTEIRLPDLKGLKAWAKSQGWPTPWFDFEEAFITKIFETNETFSLALTESGVEMYALIKEHILSLERLKELDALYEARSSSGRPTHWGSLVQELREIRRLVEAGVKVNVEGTQTVLDTWQSFYGWAHGRYHMLEDGYDSWIGDDS